MARSSEPELVQVAVTLILHRRRTLLAYNARWGAFSFPMTKIRHRVPGPFGTPPVPESPSTAALRAAAEVLGRPLPPDQRPTPLPFDLEPYQFSGRDGELKRYTFHPHILRLPGMDVSPYAPIIAWLTRDELADHEPISPTVRLIVDRLPLSDWE